PLFHERLEDRLAAADADEDEVRVAGDELEAERGELVLHPCAALDGEVAGLALVLVVEDAGERAGLGDAVDVEGLAGLLQDIDEFLAREAVADAEIREALDFREGAEDDDVAALADVAENVGRVGQELVVGFIENGDDAVGHAGHEAVDLLLRAEG